MKIPSEEESIDLNGEETQNNPANCNLTNWEKSLFFWNGTRDWYWFWLMPVIGKENKKLIAKHDSVEILTN